MEFERLFEIAEKILEEKEELSTLKKFPESSLERKPFENPFRRSALIVSGDGPKHLKKVFQREADVIIFNVEDGVAESNKRFARLLLRKFLKNVPFDGSKEVVIRINPLNSEFFWEDILELLPVIPHAVRLSKVERPEDVIVLDGIIKTYERSAGLPESSIKIQLSIETGKAVERLSEILSASKRINAAYLGILDLFADLGLSQELVKTSPLATFLKSKFVSTCRAFGVAPVAPAYQDYEDLEGFKKEAEKEKELGFVGKMCISVKQVGIANKVFSPSKEEIEEAKKIVELYERALNEGKGGITYSGKFIDQPIYRDALNKLKFLGS
jgi:citrate lyase subunit beta/citryl-CoA lyase